jgi:hypothetical protein
VISTHTNIPPFHPTAYHFPLSFSLVPFRPISSPPLRLTHSPSSPVRPMIGIGAFAERGRLGPVLVFVFVWSTLVYGTYITSCYLVCLAKFDASSSLPCIPCPSSSTLNARRPDRLLDLERERMVVCERRTRFCGRDACAYLEWDGGPGDQVGVALISLSFSLSVSFHPHYYLFNLATLSTLAGMARLIYHFSKDILAFSSSCSRTPD